jgi:hypothetical protein
MIHKGLTEVGLVQTSDTGQINLETVELPAVSTTAGYEIWRFNDANQSNDPIYLKIEYGLGTTTSRPRLICSVGTGSNGSGTLTNPSSTFFGSVSNTATGTPEFHVCHVDGTLVFMEAPVEAQSSTNTYCFIIERYRDNKGAVITSGGFMGWVVGCVAATQISSERRSGSYSNVTLIYLGAGTQANADGRKLLAPLITQASNHLVGIVGALSSEIVFGDTGKITLYGVERSYRATGAFLQSFASALGGGAAQASRCLLLNE